MSNKDHKPKLNPYQLVHRMKDEKGISFNYTSENDAVDFLTDHNNYLRTACYRFIYPKYQSGENKGKYMNLDFAYLQELSVLDMHYRFLVKKMCSDIEHSLCMMLLKLIDNDPTTDGYDIVEHFLDSHKYVLKNLERSICSPHTGNLIQKYFTITTNHDETTGKNISTITSYNDCPAWVLIECLTFGDLLEFYKYYCKTRNIDLPASWSTLNLVRSLRNGASHDVCLLCHLTTGSCIPSQEITLAVKHIPSITTSQRQKKLSSRTLLEFTALIYLYDKVVQGNIKKHRSDELYELFTKRFTQSKEFYKNNNILITSYHYCCKIIDHYM